jgi:sugar phosphate isomerase/epimerase
LSGRPKLNSKASHFVEESIVMGNELNRRDLLKGGTVICAGGAASPTRGSDRGAAGMLEPAASRRVARADIDPSVREDRFLFGLNTSTIRGQKLSITEEIAIAEKAGYQAMEPWIDELERYAASGGSLDDLGKRFRDARISVESAIGFFEWIVDDPARRRKGLEAARRSMDLVRRIDGKRLAAPPVGATDRPIGDLLAIADRYRALLELGDELGVVPQVEIWGPSKTLGRLGEAALVAIEAHHPKACILADVYHLYRGGSGFEGIKVLGPGSIHVLHFNDYPADPPREQATDADRVFPGDGIAPLKSLLRDLASNGFRVTLSLELFNRKLWSQDPLAVAKTGLARMKALFERGRAGPR